MLASVLNWAIITVALPLLLYTERIGKGLHKMAARLPCCLPRPRGKSAIFETRVSKDHLLCTVLQR